MQLSGTPDLGRDSLRRVLPSEKPVQLFPGHKRPIPEDLHDAVVPVARVTNDHVTNTGRILTFDGLLDVWRQLFDLVINNAHSVLSVMAVGFDDDWGEVVVANRAILVAWMVNNVGFCIGNMRWQTPEARQQKIIIVGGDDEWTNSQRGQAGRNEVGEIG